MKFDTYATYWDPNMDLNNVRYIDRSFKCKDIDPDVVWFSMAQTARHSGQLLASTIELALEAQ